MALSKSTLEHLLEAESHIRAAIKSAAVNEKPLDESTFSSSE